jgi:hypothetical protein
MNDRQGIFEISAEAKDGSVRKKAGFNLLKSCTHCSIVFGSYHLVSFEDNQYIG